MTINLGERHYRDVQKYWSLELSWPCPRFRELLADMLRRNAVAEQHAGKFCNLGQALSTGKFTLEGWAGDRTNLGTLV